MPESTQPPTTPDPAPPRGRRRRLFEAAGVFALALALNLAGNGRISLFDRDEPRFAGCTREMRERGDWLRPTFNAEPRYHKPILVYWLMRLGFAVGGDNPFGARLASTVAGASTSLLVLSLGRRMFGDRVGLLAAVVLSTAPIMVIESKLATTDATLAFFVVLAQSSLWSLSRAPSLRWALTFWVALALATLTKGPVGPALVASAGVVSWWWGGPTAAWGRLRWRWGLPLFLLIVAPWLVAVGVISRGEFFRFALGHQVARRVVSGVEEHGGFPGYYFVTSLLTFHPWSALLPAAFLGAWERRRSDPAFGFLLGWVVGPFLLLECVRTKLVHYYLPAYPACALLAAWLVGRVVRDGVNVRDLPLGRLGLAVLVGVGAGVAALFVGLAVKLPPGLRGPCLSAAAVVGSGTALASVWFRRNATRRAVVGLAGTWALTMLLLSAWLLPSAEPFRLSRVVGERLSRLSDEASAPPILLSFQEPSMVYAMGRPAPLIRTWEQLYDQLDRHGAVVAALIPLEVPEFRRRRLLDVDYRRKVEGFNLNKGRTESVWLARIRRKPGVSAAEEYAERRSRGDFVERVAADQ